MAAPPRPPMDGSGGDRRWFGPGAASTLDRHPLIEAAMDRTARALAQNLGALSASPAEVSFQGTETGIVDDLARRGGSSLVAILNAPAWHSGLALRFERAFVSTLVEALFGGAGDDDDPAQRDFPSPVETRIGALIAEQVAEALRAGFDEILPTSFALEPIRARPDLLALGKPAASVLVAVFLFKSLDRVVAFDIVIPSAALYALGDPSTAASVTAPPSRDSRWAEQLEAGVGRAAMRLRASLDLPPMGLGEIAGLRQGQVLAFASGAGSSVKLSCEGGDLFRCVLGQSDGHYTVQVDESLAVQSPSPRKDH